MKFWEIFLSLWRFRESPDFFFTNVPPKTHLFISCFLLFFWHHWSDETQPLKWITSHFIQVKLAPHFINDSYDSPAFQYFNYHHYNKRQVWRIPGDHYLPGNVGREIELNSGSLPPIPGGLATLPSALLALATTLVRGLHKLDSSITSAINRMQRL